MGFSLGGTRSVASVLGFRFWVAATRDRGPPWGFPLEGRALSRQPWFVVPLEGRAPSRPSWGCGFGMRPRGTVALHGIFPWRGALRRVRLVVAVLGCGHEGPWPSMGFSPGGARSVASVRGEAETGPLGIGRRLFPGHDGAWPSIGWRIPARLGGTRSVASVLWLRFWVAATRDRGPPWGFPLEGRALSRPSWGCGFGLRPRGTVALHGVFPWRDALRRVRLVVVVLGCGHEGPWPSTGCHGLSRRGITSSRSWTWARKSM